MPERRHVLPDGRVVEAVDEGEPVGWVVRVVGAEADCVAGRDIHDALADLLQPGDGQWPEWFIAAADDLAARDTADGRRYACPCCGFLTLTEPPSGTYALCAVCWWEDDGVQFRDVDYEGGANTVSLRRASTSSGTERANASSAPAFVRRDRRSSPKRKNVRARRLLRSVHLDTDGLARAAPTCLRLFSRLSPLRLRDDEEADSRDV